MNTRNELSRISIDIPKMQHKLLKKLAADQGVSMRQIFLNLIDSIEECKLSHIPNDETVKAINEVKSRKNLIEAKDSKEFFKKLGI